MYIKQFSSTRFAGLKDIDLTFSPGLNVILGANETGKSTIINAIHAVLFVGTNLKKSRREDSEFLQQNMPFPAGDFIDGELLFSSQERDYWLSKRWGNRNSSSLKLPDGSLLSREADIEKAMQGIFTLGPKTYENVIFAQQSKLKQVLASLRDKEVAQSITTILRAAVIDLDGLPIDKLRETIEAQLGEMLKRWDYYNNRPAEQKIYKTGIGTVLASYYRREQLYLQMQKIFALEQELFRIGQLLNACEERQKSLQDELTLLEPLEADALHRQTLEPQRSALAEQNQECKKIAEQWPVLIHNLRRLQEELPGLYSQLEILGQEEQAWRSQQEKALLLHTLMTVDENLAKLEYLRRAQNEIPMVSADDLKCLEDTQLTVTAAAAAMRAGKLSAAISKSPDLEVWITRDLEEEQIWQATTVGAHGYLRIRLGTLAQIEVRSGDIDAADIKQRFSAAQDLHQQTLKRLGVEDYSTARESQTSLDRINDQIGQTQQIINDLLKGQDYQILKDRLEELKNLEAGRPLTAIQRDKTELENHLIKVHGDINYLQQTLLVWQDKFGDPGQLFGEIVDREVKLRSLDAEISGLQPLPPGYSDSAQFHTHLKNVRQGLKTTEIEYREFWKAYFDQERELPEESYEELQVQFEEAREDFEKQVTKAHTLTQIMAAFIATLEELEQNPLQPLEDAFSRYLVRVTGGRYRVGSLGADLEPGLISRNDTPMPLVLLSAGTYDSVGLALRFALLEQIFPGQEGFTVLDDCLVDLDPGRRDEAIQIIRDYAQKNQVVFTTCNRETAGLLGGTLIELG